MVGRRCSTCQEEGHYAPRCPSKPAPSQLPPPPIPRLATPRCEVQPRALTPDEEATFAPKNGKILLRCYGGLPFGACLCVYGECERCGKAHPHLADRDACPTDPVADVLAFARSRYP